MAGRSKTAAATPRRVSSATGTRRAARPDSARRAASLADVAHKAGVDSSTVSRVLNGDTGHRTRPETRARIEKAARSLGYRPNLVARALRTARSFSLGITVPQLDNPVFPQMIVGAEAAAREQGYALLIAHVAEHEDGGQAFERLARQNCVDGLLVATLDDDRALAPALRRTGIPYVILNRRAAGVRNCIQLDTRAAARLATSHLIQLGHKRIAHLAGRAGGGNANDRLAGYRDALKSAGLRFDPRLVHVAGYTAEGGARAMRDVLRCVNPLPTAVFAATLLSAAGAMTALRAAGLQVPLDVSVVGLHDAVLAEVLDPPLTTVRLPAQEMGYEAARGLIDLIEGRQARVERVLAPSELVVRGSAAKPRA